jgi:predicted TIM-barrel fold metal-dependent hydrolase
MIKPAGSDTNCIRHGDLRFYLHEAEKHRHQCDYMLKPFIHFCSELDIPVCILFQYTFLISVNDFSFLFTAFSAPPALPKQTERFFTVCSS